MQYHMLPDLVTEHMSNRPYDRLLQANLCLDLKLKVLLPNFFTTGPSPIESPFVCIQNRSGMLQQEQNMATLSIASHTGNYPVLGHKMENLHLRRSLKKAVVLRLLWSFERFSSLELRLPVCPYNAQSVRYGMYDLLPNICRTLPNTAEHPSNTAEHWRTLGEQ